MPEKIFISYARHDGETHAEKFNSDLKALKHETWFDRDKEGGIQPGLSWQKAIQEAIDVCTLFLLVMTPASIKSNNCFAEWSRALTHEKTIIPLRMSPTDNNDPVEYDQLPLYIETLQYIDFVDDFDSGWQRLTQRLSQLEDKAFQDAQDKARQTHRITPAFAKGYLLVDPDDVPRLADKLIGRETLKAHIQTLLGQDRTVLLHGIGGVGKTAFSAELTAERLEANNQPILWLEVGNAPNEGVFSAIGQAFTQQSAMARAKSDEEKIRFTRDLIKTHNIGCVVIDDAWNPAALTTLLKAIPQRNRIPVLITSRQRHIINGEVHPVASLLPDDARTLLTYHMANNTRHDGADDLCKAVGYHPFMLEIAGKLLKQRDISPQHLLDDMDNRNLTTLSLPEGVAEVGRENMEKLLTQSLSALPDDLTRNVFLAFGAFPNPTATAEMLALYLHDDVKIMNQEFHDAGIDENPIPIHHLENLLQVQTALDTLHQHGLARRIPPETRDDHPYAIETYRIHDLAHAYAGGQNPNFQRLVSACLAYTWRHNSPNFDNFSALRPELENLVEASTHAMTLQRWQDVEQFAWNLYSGSRFTDYQGFFTESQTLLSQAAHCAEARHDKEAYSTHLGNLGLAYDSVGNFETAIDYHQQSLAIAREIDDQHGEGIALGNLGIAYNSLKDYQTAIDYHQQSLAIAEAIDNKLGTGVTLGNLGSVYDSLQDYETAISYYQQSLAILEQMDDKDRQSIGVMLGNLGSAYNSLADYKMAIKYHEQSLAIAQEIGDKQSTAVTLGNLGRVYDALAEYLTAIDFYKQSLAIFEEIDDKQGVAVMLGNLGNAHNMLEEYETAIDYHQQALAINRATGNKQDECDDLSNLGQAHNLLEDYETAISYHQQALSLTKELDDKLRIGSVLGHLGNEYFSLEDYETAIVYHQQALTISREMGNKQDECDDLGNLGQSYIALGKYETAIDYYKQSLTLAQALDDKQRAGVALGHLGSAYDSLGNYETAIDYHRQALAISREMDNKQDECDDLGNLGQALSLQGEYETAIDYYEQSLTIAQEINDKSRIGFALGLLGSAYDLIEDSERAIDYHKQALNLFKEIDDTLSAGVTLGNLGSVYDSLEDYDTSIDYHKQALAISREMGNKQDECDDLSNLGQAHSLLGEYQLAIDYYKQALTLARALDDKSRIASALGNLGLVHDNLGRLAPALDYYQQTLGIARDLNDGSVIAIQLYNIGTIMNDFARYTEAIPLLEESLKLVETLGLQYEIPHVKQELELSRQSLKA